MHPRLRAFIETAVCIPFFVLGLALAVAAGIPFAILLFPFLRLSEWSHAKNAERLQAEGLDANCSSEEFSGSADASGGIIRTLMIMPFLPLLFAGERLETAILDAFGNRRTL